MRQIKFRAWLPNHKKMYPVISFSSKFPNEDFYRVFINKEYVEGEPANFRCGKDNPLMQFTGLLDKNGKEIYEGDIVKQIYLDDKGGEHPFNSEIIFENGAFYDDDTSLLSESNEEMEVIGNIFENAELKPAE